MAAFESQCEGPRNQIESDFKNEAFKIQPGAETLKSDWLVEHGVRNKE